MKNYRIIVLVSILVIAFALAGCGKKISESNDNTVAENDIVTEQNNNAVDEEKNTVLSDDDNQTENSIENNNKTWTEDDFRQYLVDNMDVKAEDILFAHVDDYDNDSDVEAFMFVGTSSDDEEWGGYQGNMWFTDGEKCQKLEDSFTGEWRVIDGVIDCGNRKYVYADEMYVTGSISYIWSVYNGEAKQCDLSRYGTIILKDNNSIEMVHSTYDTCFDFGMQTMLGHSWKHYYLYYDEKSDEIKEYGGSLVSRLKLQELCGFDICEEMSQKGYTITTAYYRENGILNVNYMIDNSDSYISYGNVNYDCKKHQYVDAWGAADNTLENSDFGGVYMDRLLSDDTKVSYPSFSEDTETVSGSIKDKSDVIPLGNSVQIHVEYEDEMDITEYYLVVDHNTVFDDSELYDNKSPLDWFTGAWLESNTDIYRDYSFVITNGNVDKIY